MKPSKDGGKAAFSANTVNRHIGNMRTLYTRYFQHVGEEDRSNPFRKMHFKQKTKVTKPPFSTAWLRDKVLRPEALSGWRPEIQLIAYMLVETGCRPSEIINLQPEHIHTDVEVPFIEIRGCADGETRREVKTDMSERDIPLVGVALEAAKRAPLGFPHYFDRNELVSANLMKAFRTRGLLETEDHKVYSLRHSFEKRMQEANIDYQLRCALMGHKNTRPKYGDGGELSYRRDELLKIALPYSEQLFQAFDEEHSSWWRTET
jgi:integrase